MKSMKYPTLVAGALFAASGFVSIWQGMDIVQIERGWTMVISGAVVLSGGIVTMALGLLIGAVEALANGRGRSSSARSARENPPGAAPAPAPPPPGVIAAAIIPTIVKRIEMPAAPGQTAPNQTAAPMAIEPAPAPTQRPSPDLAAAKAADAPSQSRPRAPEPARHQDADFEWLRQMVRSPRDGVAMGEEERPQPGQTSKGERPSVLRRFEAQGASYTLFTDGTIESESPVGRYQFQNMDELRTHLARLEAEAAVARGA